MLIDVRLLDLAGFDVLLGLYEQATSSPIAQTAPAPAVQQLTATNVDPVILRCVICVCKGFTVKMELAPVGALIN